MKVSITNVLTVAGLAAALWAVPSVGTRGQGTVGHGTLDDRFVHADRAIVTVAERAARDASAADAAGSAILHRADVQLAAAVAGL